MTHDGRGEIEAVLSMAIQACASARHELNELEITAWLAAIESFGTNATKSFLLNWVGSNRRAPSVSDLRKALDPSFVEEEVALEQLYKLVTSIGPYDAPSANAIGTTLCRVIENLGGWTRVNEVMPDRGDRFAWNAFADRFATAFGTARTQEFQATLLPPGSRPVLIAPVGIHQMGKAASQVSGALALPEPAREALPGCRA